MMLLVLHVIVAVLIVAVLCQQTPAPVDQPQDQNRVQQEDQILEPPVAQPRIRHQSKRKHVRKADNKDPADADSWLLVTNDYLNGRRKFDATNPLDRRFLKCVKKNTLKKCQKRMIRSLAKKQDSGKIGVVNLKERKHSRRKEKGNKKMRKTSWKKMRSLPSRRPQQSSVYCSFKDKGPTLINSSTHICCGGEKLLISSTTTVTAGSCRRDPSLTGCRGCCDNVVYNTSTHFCYQGLLQTKEDTSRLLVADINGNLYKVAMNGSVVESIKTLTTHSTYTVMMDISYTHGVVYTLESTKGLNTIAKVVLPGQMIPASRSDLFSSATMKINHLAVDWMTGNIFLIDLNASSLVVADGEFKYMKTLFQDETFFEKPKAMELYPSIGYLFVCNAGKDPHISRISMDGKTQQRLISDVVIPSAIAIDHSSNTLYWADVKRGRICMSDLIGSNKKVILETPLSLNMAMTMIDNALVWTDNETIFMTRSPHFSIEFLSTLEKILSTLEEVDNTIVAIEHHRNHDGEYNPCKRGRCSHICLLSPGEYPIFDYETGKVTAVCACADNYKLNSDNRTCSENCTRCDGNRDSEDGSDEPDNFPENSCLDCQFKCEADGKYVAKSRLCDGTEDCQDGTDEAHCSGQAMTPHYTLKRVEDLDDKVLDDYEEAITHSSPAMDQTLILVIIGIALALTGTISAAVVHHYRSTLRACMYKWKNNSRQQEQSSSAACIMNNEPGPYESSNRLPTVDLPRAIMHYISDVSDDSDSSMQQRSDTCSMHSKISVRLDELPQHPMMDNLQWEKYFTKDRCVPEKNTSESLTKTVETQTMCLKETNMRDSLGEPFQGQFTASLTEPVVQLRHSDVTMTLPRKDLQKANIQCHASSLTNVGLLRKKFKVADDERIASPAIEYQLHGMSWLEDYAVIKLPICASSNNFRITRAGSDQGAGEYFEEMQDVPRMNAKEEGQGLDFFYTPSASRAFVYIYTKHFSVYVCLYCEEEILLQPQACIFAGVNKYASNKAMVTMELVLAGQLLRFKEYEEELNKKQKRVGRKQIDFPEIKFQRNVQSLDKIEVKMSVEDLEIWDFVRPSENPNFEVATKTFPVKEMVQCECKNGMPLITCRWQIVSKTAIVPESYECNLDIFHLPHTPESNNPHNPEAAAAFQEGHAHKEQICFHAIRENTGQRRRSSGYSTASNGSSRTSMGSQQYSTGSGIQSGREPEIVRKELDSSNLPSYYNSDGEKKRHPALQTPAPEISKPPVCSYDNLGTRAVGDPV